MKKFVLFFMVCSFTGATHAADCPLGAKEDHLTIHRVMRNFGRFVSDADALAIFAKDNPGDVTDAKISEAADKMVLATACAQAVLDHPDGDLLPDHASELQGDERAQYIAKFLDFMRQFHDGLNHYHDLLTALLATPKASRNFSDLYMQYKKMDDFVDHAHDELGGGDGS